MANVSAGDVSSLVNTIKSYMASEKGAFTVILIKYNDRELWVFRDKIYSSAPPLPVDVCRLITFAHDDVDSWIQSEKLYRRYLLTRNLDDISQAVNFARVLQNHAVLLTPMAPIVRFNLARPLLRRFQHTRQEVDVSEAIKLFLAISQPLAKSSPTRQKLFGYLSIAYLERGGNLDGFVELDAPNVYSQTRPSLETLTQNLGEDEEVFHYFWNSHALDPEAQYLGKASLHKLNFEIQICRLALEFFRHDPARTGIIVSQLGFVLMQRAKEKFVMERAEESLEDVNEAVDSCCLALELVSPTSESEIFGFCVLYASKAYGLRFVHLRREEDLDKAFGFAKYAVEVFEPQNPRFVWCFYQLAEITGLRFQMTGDVNDLDAAIEHSSRAVDMGESDAQFRGLDVLLCNLGNLLMRRSLINGRAEDMSEAIDAIERAVTLLPPKDPKLALYLAKLSNCELIQFQKLLDVQYLERAVQHSQQSSSMCGEVQDWYVGSDLLLMESISLSYSYIYDITLGRVIDSEVLDRAIARARHGTLLARPSAGYGNLEVIGCYIVLCRSLFYRWERDHKGEDIDEVISAAECMLKLAEEIPELSIATRKDLGEYLYRRSKHNGHDGDRERALALLLDALRMPAIVLTSRIHAGQIAAQILSDLADWDGARQVYQEIMDISSIRNGRSLSWQDKQFWLRKYSHRVAAYASTALEAGSNVLDIIEILETYRGSILSHLIDCRTDFDDLAEVHSDKAKRFRDLQNEMNTVIDTSGNLNTRVKQTTRRIQLEEEFRACLEEIRSLPDFHRFLRGPSGEVLKAAAARGPIVIVNVTWIRSDAIIITKDGFDSLTLPDLKYQKVKEYIDADLTNFSFENIGTKNKAYRRLQEWLWDNCVKLIFKKLEEFGIGPAKFHIWWMPVGIASSLPFHAAGIFTRENCETTLSRAVCSYTPTLKVLINGQRKLKVDPSKRLVQDVTTKLEMLNTKPRLVVISMRFTPGERELEGAEPEAEEIEKIVRGSYLVQKLLQPSAKDTMVQVEKCEIVHFACHGKSTFPDVSNSHLLLQVTTPDSEMPALDKLTLRDVTTANVAHGKLAFLSACSTAQNIDTELWDEVLHLVSGFHVAGYLHAIGNLWPSDDEVSVELVRGFYEHLVAAGELGDGENIAKALNEAITAVAKKYARQPLAWAQFVHFGV